MPNQRLVLVALLGLVVGSPTGAQPPTKPTDSALAPVPPDAFFFASVKVSKLWDHAAAKPFRDWVTAQKSGGFNAALGLAPADLDRLTLFAATNDPAAGGAPILVATTRQKYDEAKLLKLLGAEGSQAQKRLASRAFEVGGLFRWVVFIDERTLLYLPRDLDDKSIGPTVAAQLTARKPDGPLAAALAGAAAHDLTIALEGRGLDAVVSEFKWNTDKRTIPYLGLLKAKTATLTADFDTTAKVQFTLTFPDAESAKRAGPVLQEGIKAITEHLTGEAEQLDPAERAVVAWVTSVLKSAKVTTLGGNVIANAEVAFADDLAKFVAAMPRQLAASRNERQAINNLKQLDLAMHSFHDANNSFPGDVVPMDGKLNAWSWRVQILPYIEQANLYNQLDLTKPWDDPANLKLLESFEMPKVFEFPGREAPKGHTYFRVLSLPKNAKGTDRPFFKEGERGPRFQDILDGTSNTFMIVEAGEAVPWYKVDVLPYDGKLPLAALGDRETDRILAAFGDGSVQSFRMSKLGEKRLRALITIQGGEVIDLPR